MATHPNTINQYNEHAENYHKHVSDPNDSTFHAYYEKPAIRTELPALDGLDVISIGCGSGVDARWLADNGAKSVVGIDISMNLLDIARSNNPDIKFLEMDMEKLDFEDASFDLAYSSLAIHYVDDWTAPLKEAYRILRPGSKYIFSCGHPIDSAVDYEIENGYKYALLGRRINQQTRDRKIYGDYLAADSGGIAPVEGTLNKIDVTVYHRPISLMIKQILDSGFKIDKMVEPLPVKAYEKIEPAIYEQLRKIPSFMIWVLEK
jgi:ubiquinone/menaquinone biosynthesis C-methylase UbiE